MTVSATTTANSKQRLVIGSISVFVAMAAVAAFVAVQAPSPTDVVPSPLVAVVEPPPAAPVVVVAPLAVVPAPPPVIAPPVVAPRVPPPPPPTFRLGALSSFPYGAESDCAAVVHDKKGVVWLTAVLNDCAWTASIDGQDVCVVEGPGGLLSIAALPALRLQLTATGRRKDTVESDNAHGRTPAVLVVDKVRTAVTIHSFCRRDDGGADVEVPARGDDSDDDNDKAEPAP